MFRDMTCWDDTVFVYYCITNSEWLFPSERNFLGKGIENVINIHSEIT